MNSSNGVRLADSFLAENHLPRPRVDKIFDRATRSKLVYVIANAGYGKTQAVRHYIEGQPDAVVRWVQLTESDNVGSRYWENLTRNISFDNPDLAAKLRELGFPGTSARFKQFAEALKSTEHRSHKTFLVLDDFHLIHTKQALTFAERCAHLHIPGACVIIISRKEPEINVVSLFARGKASIITEDDLRFTDEEIAAFLKHCGIPFSAKELPRLIGATKGWALALRLLSMVLKKHPNNLELALDTMKENIFKLLETEAFNGFPEIIQKTMVRLALVSDLPLVLLQKLFNDSSFLRDAPQLASFMWFDSFTGDYRVHPLYWEFLLSKQDILSEEEKRDTYRQAAHWCSENNFYTDAVNYYARSRQFERMARLLLSFPFRLPYDACEYFLSILEGLDPGPDETGDYSVLFLKNFFIPLMLMGMGRYEEARGMSLDVVREWEHQDKPFSFNLLYAAYSNLAYIDMYTCTATHKYAFPEHMKRALKYYKMASMTPVEITGAFAVADMRSYACLVGEGADLSEFDQFLEASRQTAVYLAEASYDLYSGYEDLLACEIAFHKNQLDSAKKYARRAILKAREKKQYSIEAVADQFLLHISTHERDYPLVKELLKQLRGHLANPDFWNRQLLYDLFVGLFYAQIGLPGMAPAWLVMNEKETTSEVRIPVRELIASVKYYIASKKYNQALTVLCKSFPREPQERFLFGELTLTLLTAVARIKTGDAQGAMEDFKKAYALSLGGVFEMPFIELGRNLQPLAAAASKQADCGIPDEWRKAIGRKASIYAKKADVIMYALKREQNIKDTVQLSEREQEVLSDLYHGLNRDEIAENRYLSINTVKKILQSVYIKLNANNIADAIRIAIKTGLIE